VGAAGAFAASRAGRLADKGHARLATVAFLSTIVVSYVVIATGAHHVVPLVIGITLLDLGVQGTQVTNQSVIYQLRGEARSRITTIYMASYFLGGVIGSSIAAVANDAGWTTVCITGAAPCVLALLVWVISGRHANVSVSSGEPQPLTRKS
jgi:predicted MFS family arabinose efflux permease